MGLLELRMSGQTGKIIFEWRWGFYPIIQADFPLTFIRL